MSAAISRAFLASMITMPGVAVAAGRDLVGAAIGAAIAAGVIGGLFGAATWFDNRRKAASDANPGVVSKGFFDTVLRPLLWGTVVVGILFLWWIVANK